MNDERLLTVLQAPHVSEKSTRLTDDHAQYVFKVRTDAVKPEIQKAEEKLFNVAVKDVRVSNVKQKPRRFGKILGHRKSWKKAYVSLKEGHKIDIAAAQS